MLNLIIFLSKIIHKSELRLVIFKFVTIKIFLENSQFFFTQIVGNRFLMLDHVYIKNNLSLEIIFMMFLILRLLIKGFL